MTTPSGAPHSDGGCGDQPRRLPPYQALFAVDIRDYSGHQGRDHAQLTRRIPRILNAAFHRAGLEELWSEEIWQRMIGDSYVAGFRPSVLPLLLNPLLGALQAQLRHENRTDAIGDPPRPLRMRVSIHVGPVTEPTGDRDTDGSGAARVEVHRLLDADAVKSLLSRAENDTCVAAIVSERAYCDAVESGYTGERPSSYARTTVKVKNYEATAYLRVPHSTGELVARGLLSPEAAEDSERPAQELSGAAGLSSGSVGRDAVQAGTYNDHRVVGVGTARDIDNVFTGTRGPVYIGDGNGTDRRPSRRRRPRRDG
jgi:hypothetical protein